MNPARHPNGGKAERRCGMLNRDRNMRVADTPVSAAGRRRGESGPGDRAGLAAPGYRRERAACWPAGHGRRLGGGEQDRRGRRLALAQGRDQLAVVGAVERGAADKFHPHARDPVGLEASRSAALCDRSITRSP